MLISNAYQMVLNPLLIPGVGMWLLWHQPKQCVPLENDCFYNECVWVPKEEVEDYSYWNCSWKLELTATQCVCNYYTLNK